MADKYVVPMVTATLASLDNFNNPLIYIQNALNGLWDRTTLLYNKSAVIMYDQPVADVTAVGDLVYYNTDTGELTPAQALLRAEPGDQGQSLLADCARIVGIITDINGVTGTVLCGGMYKDGALTDACLGVNAVPGTYYLSPDTAGKAVLDPGQALRQPALLYMGDGKFSLSTFYLAHDGHQHTSAILDVNNWVADTIDGLPIGSYTYDVLNDAAVKAMGQLSLNTTALFVDGVLQVWPDNNYRIDATGLRCFTIPSASSTYVLFNHYPLAYGAPVVRDIIAESPRISATRKGGVILLDILEYSHVPLPVSGVAIQRIELNTAYTTTVITEVKAGIGTAVYTSPAGVATITNTALDSVYTDATVVNLNGAVHILLNGIVFVAFPGGRQTLLNMHCPVHHIPAGASASAYVWLQHTGPAVTPLVTLRFIPNTEEEQALPVLAAAILMTLPLTATGTVVRTTSTGALNITEPGYLCATVSMTPSSTVKVLRQGFIVVTNVGA